MQETLSRAITDLLLSEPFYGHFLQNIPRSFSDSIRTACVGISRNGFRLVFNPRFLMEELNRDTRLGVLKHEVLHLVLRHLQRSGPYRNHRLQFNIAADLVVNQYVAGHQLPAGAVRLSDFRELSLPPHESLDYYFERLKAASRQMSIVLPEGVFDSHEGWFSQSPGMADGDGASGFGSLEETLLDEHLRSAYRKHLDSRLQGRLPGEIEAALRDVEARMSPTLDWKTLLRQFASSSRSTGIAFTKKRISRRFGTRPGIRIQRRQRLLVAIDTSGSIGDDRLTDFFTEIDAIWRQGADIIIIECDARTYEPYPYQGQMPEKVKGRGGTDFDPVFQHINQSPESYDGCIYLTDGHASTPTIQPRCRLLWVLTPHGSRQDLPFGSSVRIDR